jgi:hypothetical protein
MKVMQGAAHTLGAVPVRWQTLHYRLADQIPLMGTGHIGTGDVQIRMSH